MSQIPRQGMYQKPNIVRATTSQSTMDPETHNVVSETNTSIIQVSTCPGSAVPSRLRAPGQLRPPSQLRAPGQSRSPSQLGPPSQLRAPGQSRSPSQLGPPGQPPSQMRPPGQLRPPSQLRPPGQLRPPSQLRPPGQMTAGPVIQESGSCRPCGSGATEMPARDSPARRPQRTGQVTGSPSFQELAALDRQMDAPSRLPQVRRQPSPRVATPPAQQVPMPSRMQSPAPGLSASELQHTAYSPVEKRITVPMDEQQPSTSATALNYQAQRAPRTLRQPSSGIRPPAGMQASYGMPISSGLQLPGIRPPQGMQVTSGIRPPTSRLQPPRTQALPQKSVEQEVSEDLHMKALQQPGQRVSAKGKRTANLPIKSKHTPAGTEQVLQEAVFEERVERDATGERVVKNLSVADLNQVTGMMDQVQLGIQQLDPRYAKTDGEREVIGVTSTVSVTNTYRTVDKECLRISTAPEGHGISMSPAQIAQLVEEEKEDVDNTLKMVPPDLTTGPGKFGFKQRLQRLRLNSESMALLEQSIIRPELTADEPQAEPNPEIMASMMHTVEKGITPEVPPDEVFNTLFQETVNEQFVHLNSVSPGPLQDIVVPREVPRDIHREALSNDMDRLCDKLENVGTVEEVPYVDIFTRVMDDMAKSPKKGKNHPRSFQPISDEKSLWVNANLEHLVHICGAEPAEVLEPYDLDELETSEDIEKELSYGIDFFLECNPLQYVSRVQLRGTQLPSYFPGYMVALPDFPEIVKIARSPDEVFASAWKSVQPKYFPDDSTQSFIC